MPIHYTDPTLDVPPGVDFLDPAAVESWIAACETDKPWRVPMRSLFVELLQELPEGAHVLELGSGPGLLAEAVLQGCPHPASYTLLDFSETMLSVSRARLERFPKAQFVRADFKTPAWTSKLRADYGAVLAMQAVHEIRHKRHVPGLYQQVASLLVPGGRLLVCDGMPKDASLVATSLYMTEDEQLAALQSAGFVATEVQRTQGNICFVTGRKPLRPSITRDTLES